jgi:arginyl-tRNA synthetase
MPTFLNFVENIMHFEDCKTGYFVNYSISRLSSLINENEEGKSEAEKV